MAEKPILFNTEMVKAILAGKKTQTRRLCKGQPQDGVSNPITMGYEPPYHPGDVMWVRETWCQLPVSPGGKTRIPGHYYYRADPEIRPIGWRGSWCPSIHMPRKAARLFLRVKDVRCEQLQDMSYEDCIADGGFTEEAVNLLGIEVLFGALWDSTIKKADLNDYGWFSNPWVWVIEFDIERR